MTAAVFGLLGVIVGAISAGGVSWLLARRAEEIDLRLAARLVSSDFYLAQALANPVRSTGRWGTEKTPFALDAYAEHCARLAAHLDGSTWKLVEGTVLGIRYLIGVRDAAELEGRDFTEAELGDFERIGAWIDDTLVALERWS